MTKKWKLETDISYKGWEVIQYVLDLQSDFYTGLLLFIVWKAGWGSGSDRSDDV